MDEDREDIQGEHRMSEPLIEIDDGSDNQIGDIDEDEFDHLHEANHEISQLSDNGSIGNQTISDVDIEDQQDEELSSPSNKRKGRTKSFVKPSKEKANDSIKYTKCELCNKSFRSQAVYLQHLQSKHPETDQLSYPCSKCPKRFLSKKNAKLHESVHLPDDQKFIHPCNFCDKK